MTSKAAVSSAFIWRRVHSLMGFWLIIYLIEHLLVNSQAALWIGDDGHGFIRLVNSLESLPYLQVVETLLIGIPLVIHGVWGISRIFEARPNSDETDGSSPSLGHYGRNRAFTWQRLTSWILLIGIVAHVIQMRFIERPKEVEVRGERKWEVRLSFDEGLKRLAERLHVDLISLQPTVALAPDMGTATLLIVRDTFKSPWLSILYSIFVLAAVFHACNGFWTFLISWGAVLSYRSQKALIPYSIIGMGLLSFLGLAAIWGSYWINLRQ